MKGTLPALKSEIRADQENPFEFYLVQCEGMLGVLAYYLIELDGESIRQRFQLFIRVYPGVIAATRGVGAIAQVDHQHDLHSRSKVVHVVLVAIKLARNEAS